MVTVLGYRDVNFEGKEGKVEGRTYYIGESDVYGCHGIQTDKLFISKSRLDTMDAPNVNDEIEIEYNKYGKVRSIRIV